MAAAHSRHMRPGLPSTKVKPPRHKRHGRVPERELLQKPADTAASKEHRRLRPFIGEPKHSDAAVCKVGAQMYDCCTTADVVLEPRYRNCMYDAAAKLVLQSRQQHSSSGQACGGATLRRFGRRRASATAPR